MKNNSAVNSILDDREKEYSSIAFMNKIAKPFSDCKEMHFFKKVVNSASESSEELDAAIHRLANDYSWVKSIFKEIKKQISIDDIYLTPVQAVSNKMFRGILLYDDPKCKLIITTIDKALLQKHKHAHYDRRSVFFEGYDTHYIFNSEKPIIISIWECPEYNRETDLRTIPSCKKLETIEFCGHRSFSIKGGKQSLIVESVEETSTVLLFRKTLNCAPYTLEYDVDKLNLIKHLSIDNVVPWTKIAFSYLNATNRKDAIPYIEKYLDHPSSDLRWAAVTQLMGLGGSEKLIDQLHYMATNDPKNEIRTLSQETINLINELD